MPDINDINCDLGEHETAAQTSALMRWISSASIACGGHAGTSASMRHCAEEAARHHVHVGAHPGLADAFGRGRSIPNVVEFTTLLEKQIENLLPVLDAVGLTLHHVKLHGSLYHATDRSEEMANAYVEWMLRNHPRAIIYARSGGPTSRSAEQHGATVWHELFLDRNYCDDGSLIPREKNDALLSDTCQMKKRLGRFREEGVIIAQSGAPLPLRGDTFCIHGDGPQAVAFARCANEYLIL
jgi:UPF0271 protein